MIGAPSPRLPVVEHLAAPAPPGERRALARLAAKLLADEPTLSATAPFGAAVRPGLGPWPSLAIEDHSWIALFEARGDVIYGYRAMALAGDGDMVAIGASRSPGFEWYYRELLRLGRVEVLVPAPAGAGQPLAIRCAEDARLVDHLATRARAAGGLNLLPYMGTGGVWRLAGAVAARAGVAVKVAAPPPRLTRRVNDKTWFTQRVEEVLGPRAHPPASPVFGPAALAARTAALAARCESVAVKLPDSASAAGNIVLRSPDLRGLALGAVRQRLLDLLRRAGWRGAFPLQVTAWEEPVLASPSVHLWIAEPAAGGPIVEGVFEQRLAGSTGAFTGAVPATLPLPLRRRLAGEATRLGCLFQDLGYFGRCSFDAIVVGDDPATAALHWIECNGRWGGVSLPLTLANRLVGDWRDRPFVVAERSGLRRPPRDLRQVLDELGPQLFVAGERATGAVLLSPGPIEAGTGFEIMVLGETAAAADAQARVVAALLAGEPPPPA